MTSQYGECSLTSTGLVTLLLFVVYTYTWFVFRALFVNFTNDVLVSCGCAQIDKIFQWASPDNFPRIFRFIFLWSDMQIVMVAVYGGTTSCRTQLTGLPALVIGQGSCRSILFVRCIWWDKFHAILLRKCFTWCIGFQHQLTQWWNFALHWTYMGSRPVGRGQCPRINIVDTINFSGYLPCWKSWQTRQSVASYRAKCICFPDPAFNDLISLILSASLFMDSYL